MKIGTKSVLFGVHCWFLHPWFVALSWALIYGFPLDPRLWIAFWIHDLGYIGKPNMDGPEGETHVEFAATVMTRLFGPQWGDFCRYHSRFYAKKDAKPISMLCIADKMCILVTPKWLNLLLMRLSGEHDEYAARRKQGEKYAPERGHAGSEVGWYDDMIAFLRTWIPENLLRAAEYPYQETHP